MNTWFLFVFILFGMIFNVNGPENKYSCKCYCNRFKKGNLIWLDGSRARVKRFYRQNLSPKEQSEGFVIKVDTDAIKGKVKNATSKATHKLPHNWKEVKSTAGHVVHDVKCYFKKKHIKENIEKYWKNHTQPVKHPPIYKETIYDHHTTTKKPKCKNSTHKFFSFPHPVPHPANYSSYEHTDTSKTKTTTKKPFGYDYVPISLNLSHSPPLLTTTEEDENSWFDDLGRSSGKIKVVIDVEEKGSYKSQRNVKDEKIRNEKPPDWKPQKINYESEGNATSTNVLVTAEEMATDLVGRVSSLWHCVLGSHKSPDLNDVKYFLYTR